MSIWRSLLFVLALSGASSEECKVLAKPRDGNPKNYDSVEIFWSNENDFRVTKRLGSGSFGEAYLGHNMSAPEQDREQFVIKVYRFGKIKVKKMVREIMVTQRVCGHPNIVRLHHVIHQSLTGYPALVLEYTHNSRPYRELYPTFTPDDVRWYAFQLLRGLSYAHERGVVHKDLKPQNVMIDHEKHSLKIIDWGLARLYDKDEETTVAGTLYYKSPEMLLESHHTDLSTDMWSVGSLLAAWLFRKPIYFKGEEDELNQLRKIANVLGTPALLDMVHKYKLKFNDSMIAEPIPKVSWESLVTESTAAFATADALDLLDRMLVYDHSMRISAHDALMHPYFKPARAQQQALDAQQAQQAQQALDANSVDKQSHSSSKSTSSSAKSSSLRTREARVTAQSPPPVHTHTVRTPPTRYPPFPPAPGAAERVLGGGGRGQGSLGRSPSPSPSPSHSYIL